MMPGRPDRRRLARCIVDAALEAVQPRRLIAHSVSLHGHTLCIQGQPFQLRADQKIHLFGSGKAAHGMAAALLNLLGDRIGGGLIVVPGSDSEGPLPPLRVIQGSHPVPDQRSVSAAEQLIAALSRLDEGDLFLYCLSGGSSSLIEKPRPPITLAEIQLLTAQLLHRQASIDQINAVRKHLSMVKGGRLAQSTRATGVVLVVSDVISDDLTVIGSAPLHSDHTTFSHCRQTLEQLDLWQSAPTSVRQVIEHGIAGRIPDTPKQPLGSMHHTLIGSNRTALSAARHAATGAGLPTHILTSSLCGEAREVARVLVAIAESIRLHGEPFEPPVCLLLGGEPTVTVSGGGSGGRNQELALSALARIGSRDGILLVSVGSDGIDGSTTAAGAVADAGYFLQGDSLGLSIDDHLQANDSHHYWQQVGGLIVTGPTGTNVMDLVVVLIDRGIP